MQLNIQGLVHNLVIARDNGLLPLYEAITNSAQAIEGANENQGDIVVQIRREPEIEGLDENTRAESPIRDLVIEDNGIGFTSENFRSFCTGHSTYKIERGGKGIGRFSWLKVFRAVEIESTFVRDGEFYRRTFNFGFKFKEEDCPDPALVSEKARKTTIRLLGMHPEYQARTARLIDTIAHRLIRHHYSLFLQADGPKISLLDEDKRYCLNDIFSEAIGQTETRHEFRVGGKRFSLVGLRYSNPPSRLTHRLIFAGDGREVQSFDLGKDVPALRKHLINEDGKMFAYLGIIEGTYLDENLESERTGFRIPKSSTDGQLQLDGAPLFDEIKKAAIELVKRNLSDCLVDHREALIMRVAQFIKADHPRYRPLLSELDRILENFDPGESNAALELFLHQEYNKKMSALREQGQKLAAEEPTLANQEKLERFVREANQVGQSELATYVAYRRWILSLLRKSFHYVDGTRKFAKEAAVHTLICPMRVDSSDLHYEDQNLWVVDERLSFHHFLSSDKELRSLPKEVLDAESRLRPDIVLFDTPHVFLESEDDSPQNSVTLLEFKRPDRDDYKTGEEDPFIQVYRQMKDIKQGEYRDANGRKVNLASKDVPFYAYIICDIGPKIRDTCNYLGHFPTPDNQGYFGFNPNEKMYVEVISYDKLLSDAEKRNKVLFDKLQLPKDYFRITSETLDAEVSRRNRKPGSVEATAAQDLSVSPARSQD